MEIRKLRKNSLFFISQASYPVKGFHIFLDALSILKDKYPNVKVYVGGYNPTDKSTLKNRLKRNYYGIYLEKRIKELNLEKNIIFTGVLSEKEVLGKLLNSNVFVSPSTIENSPNSVGEAMLLGVPIVSSYVGGVMDMLVHKKEGFLYQGDAPYMLAYYIDKVFNEENTNKITSISRNARARAKEIFDKDENAVNLIEIYKEILKNTKIGR